MERANRNARRNALRNARSSGTREPERTLCGTRVCGGHQVLGGTKIGTARAKGGGQGQFYTQTEPGTREPERANPERGTHPGTRDPDPLRQWLVNLDASQRQRATGSLATSSATGSRNGDSTRDIPPQRRNGCRNVVAATPQRRNGNVATATDATRPGILGCTRDTLMGTGKYCRGWEVLEGTWVRWDGHCKYYRYWQVPGGAL